MLASPQPLVYAPALNMAADPLNYLVLKVELEVLPEKEEEEDDGRDFPYWYIEVPLFAGGIALFAVAYKWAAASQVRYERQMNENK